jgi:choline-sulfatase
MARNLLFLMADQLGAHALEDESQEFLDAPHLSRLREEGAAFARAYTPFPLCVPARSALLAGRAPHDIGIDRNRPSEATIIRFSASRTLPRVLQAHGIRTEWGGKWHAPRVEVAESDGFALTRPFGDLGLADWAAERLHDLAGREQPFALFVSFDDPHTICEYARGQPMPYGDLEPVTTADAPPLPRNHGPLPYEPEALAHERSVAQNVYATGGWGPDEWRRYRWAYARLVERVDRQIGTVLAALESSGAAEDTLVVFTADHGDGDAAHQWSQKSALYEECIRVPLLLRAPGGPSGLTCRTPVSTTALVPTLCAELGVAPPPGVPTGSLLSGAPTEDIVVETRIDHSASTTTGRSLLHGEWKYTVYSWGRHREQLHHLGADPLEMRNLAVESRHGEVLASLRRRLLERCLRDGDPFARRIPLPPDLAPEIRERIFTPPY